MPWKHFIRVTVGCMAAVVILSGCGGPAPEPASGSNTPKNDASNTANPVQDSGTPVDGDWIVSRFPAEMATLNPLLSSHDAYAKTITDLIYEGLLKRDNETWEMKPCLAESHEISEDKLLFTFKLRKDVKFSDGTPFTSADVKFTFDILMNPTSDSMPLRNYFENVERCETPDDYTVRFVCKTPYFKTLISLGEDLRVLPKHIFSTGDFNTHPNNRHPIGTGPFVFESWDTNQQLVIARNEQYWGVKPHVLKRQYKVITDDNAALQVLQRGDLDIMAMTPDQWVGSAVNAPEFEARFMKMVYPVPHHGYIGWNMRRPLFSDKKVRQAMTMLLDRQTILATILQGMGTEVTSDFIIDSIEYNKDITPWPFDPPRARKQLEEAGWGDTNGDGIREKDGQKFEFEFMVPSGSPDTEAMATVFKEELQKAGVKMNIRLLEWATFAETVQKLNFDAMIMGWQMDPEQDPYQIWHSSQAEKGSNYPGFKNAEVDKLIEDARKEFDLRKRAALYHRMSAIIYDEQPYTFLYCPKARAAIDKRFNNVKAYRLGLDGREWWVPKDQQKYH